MAVSNLVHPRGAKAEVLLSSVFGPYAQNDEYGSREINPMELYHNQVTRVQGPFSLRMFHRSFGLMMIQENIDAPCRLLDFPTLDRFIEEIKSHSYDIIGISSINCNWAKVKKMCEVARVHLPKATIVVGGHIANVQDILSKTGADHIVLGEGVRWFRKFLGQDENAPVKHPLAYSGFGTRSFGVTAPEKPGDTAAILIPSVGCPLGCNFCSTSAQFGGKGKFINFYETGDALFSVICGLEEKLKSRSFFVLDENFLLHKKRALRLLELMEQHDKGWIFYVFSSASVLRSYTVQQLISLGITWVWMGLEGENSKYPKLQGADTLSLVRELQSHGICVLGSSIIGLEDHTPENIGEAVDYAVRHNTAFHQFMLYTPLPGTPLYDEHLRDGSLLSEEECPTADIHGQYRFNYRHGHISGGLETEFILRAFQRDFEANGPSLARMMRTMLTGWKRYKNHADQRIRERYQWKCRRLKDSYAGAVWAMKKWYGSRKPAGEQMASLLHDLYEEFGWLTRAVAPIIGRVLHFAMKLEAARLARGWTYEPGVVYEKNARAISLEKEERASAWKNALKFIPRLIGGMMPERGFGENQRRKFAGYSCRVRERLSSSTLVPMELFGKGVLYIKLRTPFENRRPLIVDLQGIFNAKTAMKLKKKIKAHLRENSGHLAINFSNLASVESKALLRFLKKLRGFKERIKIVYLDSLGEDMAEAVRYAKKYFEVFKDEERLAGSMA
ncbi:MAG: cobalamin B12-binding domain-containing protein [Nitrospinae bacterium]|nr:cobalamin B12-binding domain-containing protein [Nitrospinota bacterium]